MEDGSIIIILANLNDNTSKCTHLRKRRLQKDEDSRATMNYLLNLMTADDAQIPCVDPQGSFAMPRDIKITAEVCDSRPLATIPWADLR